MFRGGALPSMDDEKMPLTSQRSFLFLQGPPSGFWHRLADGLEDSGARISKVNLCAADWLFWRRPGALNYRGSLEDWRSWLTQHIEDTGVTDVIYYADQLPYHMVAREVAEEAGARAWAMEFGYLRPDWLTIEPGGMGREIGWLKDPEILRGFARGSARPDMSIRYTHGFVEEAVGEVSFNLAMVLGWPFFPRYRSDKFQHPIFDYLCWIPELLREPLQQRAARQVERSCRAAACPYHLLAMQLQSDYQVRSYTPYTHLEEMIDEVLASFAQHAAPGHRLVIKVHPLDNGAQSWPRRVRRIAKSLDVEDRVFLIKGGDLGHMLDHADGVVLANSTVGLHALRRGVPVKVMGRAVYDIEGLTHQGPLSDFWETPEVVDPELAEGLIRAMAAKIQVKGSFYDREGQSAAIRSLVSILLGEAQEAPAQPQLALAGA